MPEKRSAQRKRQGRFGRMRGRSARISRRYACTLRLLKADGTSR